MEDRFGCTACCRRGVDIGPDSRHLGRYKPKTGAAISVGRANTQISGSGRNTHFLDPRQRADANFRFYAEDHISWEPPMEAQNPFDTVREMMIENLEKAQKATQSYIDLIDKTIRGFPSANEEQISTFKEYLERQVATNRDFGEKLLHARDFQDAFRIQVEYFQSQLKAAAEDATRIGAKMAGSFNRTG